jgi:transposase
MPPPPYPSDLSNEERAILEPLLSSAEKRGRPPKWPPRHVADAVFYLLRSGCAWRMLPREYPPWQRLYYHRDHPRRVLQRFSVWLTRLASAAHDAYSERLRQAFMKPWFVRVNIIAIRYRACLVKMRVKPFWRPLAYAEELSEGSLC